MLLFLNPIRIAFLSALLVVLLVYAFFVMQISTFPSHMHNLNEYKTIEVRFKSPAETLSPYPDVSSYREKKICPGKLFRRTTYTFLDKFFERDDFYIGLGNKPFLRCKTSGCCATNDRSFLDISAAIIFHIRDLNLKDMPSRRSVNQRWIFFLQESPDHTPNILYDLNNVFNWTMTYRIDSDIYMPYPVLEPTPRSSYESEIWNETLETNMLNRKIRQKKKFVAWFVSNCITTSAREKYVAELQKYVQVHVYGTCGPLECANHLECYEMLKQDYKFYLSFENSICRDYVTEKFYNALRFDVVPVVYGGANYTSVAPNGSYIDVRDFASVRHLAEYLKFLDKNDTAYLRYFDWRKSPSGLSALPRLIQSWCTLCCMLNNASLPSSSYSNIHSWWFKKGRCENDHTSIQKLAV